MSAKKRKNIGWTLQELMIKIAAMTITIGIGLWCGWTDSYSAFYIAVLVQAVNNLYDSSVFLKDYTKFITVFQLLAESLLEGLVYGDRNLDFWNDRYRGYFRGDEIPLF